MAQVYHYLGLGLYYGMWAAFVVCFLIILWQMATHRYLWAAGLSLVFLFACGLGTIIALIIGWQEAWNWKIKNVMIVYTILLFPCGYSYSRKEIMNQMYPPPVEDPKKKGMKKPAPTKPATPAKVFR